MGRGDSFLIFKNHKVAMHAQKIDMPGPSEDIIYPFIIKPPIMSKQAIYSAFAERLREAMISAGHHSTRSNSGVCIHTLTNITGYSRQICRKYLQAEVLPEPHTLLKLAHALNVSPGWLLFGEDRRKVPVQGECITIDKAVLEYVLTHQSNPYQQIRPEHDIPNFLLNLIQEISELEGTQAHLKKIVDLALSSAQHFDKTKV